MSNITQAINIALALSSLIGHLTRQVGRVMKMIAQAQARGEDLSDEQIAQIRADRDEAVRAWHAAALPAADAGDDG